MSFLFWPLVTYCYTGILIHVVNKVKFYFVTALLLVYYLNGTHCYEILETQLYNPAKLPKCIICKDLLQKSQYIASLLKVKTTAQYTRLQDCLPLEKILEEFPLTFTFQME